MSHFNAIVAGVGTMGSAACYHLAKRGVSVLGLEQFSIPHANGSHHGHSRMIRQAYFEHPDYVPLLQRAYELWDQLQSEADFAEQFFYRTGGLYLGSEKGTIVPGSIHAAEKHGLEYEKLTPTEAEQRFPSFRIDPSHTAFFEREAGFLIPEFAVDAHAKLASRHGAALHENEPILSYESHEKRVVAHTARATYTADHLILSSGAWTATVAQQLRIPLQVTRQILAWFQPKGDAARFAPDVFPCWFIETDPPFGHYGFPMRPGDPGLKIAIHKPGQPIDPNDLHRSDQAPTESEIASLRSILDAYFPGSVNGVEKSATCLYTNSPDGHFLVGSHPEQPRVTIAAGFSGHGFKFAPVIGEVLADLATKCGTRLPVQFLDPKRVLG